MGRKHSMHRGMRNAYSILIGKRGDYLRCVGVHGSLIVKLIVKM